MSSLQDTVNPQDASSYDSAAGVHRREAVVYPAARGEPKLWSLGGTLAFGVLMITGFLILVLWNGIATFWPKPIAVVTLADGKIVAGEQTREELFKPTADQLAKLTPQLRAVIAKDDGYATRRLYRTGNFDFYGDDSKWVADYDVAKVDYPRDMVLAERREWGPFVGRLKAVVLDGVERPVTDPSEGWVRDALGQAQARLAQIRKLERDEIGGINHKLEQERLALRRVLLKSGADSAAYGEAQAKFAAREAELKKQYEALSAEAQALKGRNERDRIILTEVGGAEKSLPLSVIVRAYDANDIGLGAKLAVYGSRWAEFLTDEPREANTEGGVMPAIFGTFAMTVLLSLIVAPFGVLTALYLREYAKQGRIVAFVRISVNNLAGVPSIVYGVFGLGFFAYILGGSIDRLFFPEYLPNPTFGTGGLLWAALTLAIMTVPVVIVATEEALAAVPRSMREGSLACGASKWQTIRMIVLPRAMPGIMTGLILAMARGAGEVAPLMLVGVVKLAPELPIDGYFPFVHLERSFMHLGFHIFDVGFQSRNSEAGKPMVFVTTLLLIALIAIMNATAITIRNRLKKKFAGSQF
ncbi:MAG: phosphate ABC transporter permease PstA [Alphaproteobacteria bacterium]|jgi:phosphate transport system permease protein|nr:phosphate ABC transporter permease PstA [Alphaproteobacteria bacterium]